MNDSIEEYLGLISYLLLCHGKNENAVRILDALLVLNPDHSHARDSMAFALLLAERFEDCLEHLDESPEDTTNQLRTLVRARALWNLGREDEAVQLMQNMKTQD